MNTILARHSSRGAHSSNPSSTPRSATTLGVRLGLALLLSFGALAEVALHSPGLPPSRMDDQGRLVEDWGAVGIRLTGEGLATDQGVTVTEVKLDGHIPAAQARQRLGSIACALTAFRAPVWPSGLDVLTVAVEETSGHASACTIALDLPANVRVGAKTVLQGGRPILALPATPRVTERTRDWGYRDDAVSLPGWARPEGACDPAFRNIRAGLGGVPIEYRFNVVPGAAFNVVLGFCESHWAQSGQRPVVCRLEGAAPQEIDPIARWGQHQPGAVLFAAKDANGDGCLDLAVLPRAGAPDLNPILNVIWIFLDGPPSALDRVIAGQSTIQALRHVDVGGDKDQSLHSAGLIEYELALPPNGRQELVFLVACPGSSAPRPDQTGWTAETLRRAANEVWRDWR